jgi:hypothetical protein
MGFRTRLINKRAAHLMRAGEEIEQVAIVRGTGSEGGNYAVAATPSSVYVFELAGAGFSEVASVRARIPIRKAILERRASFLRVGRRGAEKPEHVFSTLPGGAPRRLEAYVRARKE